MLDKKPRLSEWQDQQLRDSVAAQSGQGSCCGRCMVLLDNQHCLGLLEASGTWEEKSGIFFNYDCRYDQTSKSKYDMSYERKAWCQVFQNNLDKALFTALLMLFVAAFHRINEFKLRRWPCLAFWPVWQHVKNVFHQTRIREMFLEKFPALLLALHLRAQSDDNIWMTWCDMPSYSIK